MSKDEREGRDAWPPTPPPGSKAWEQRWKGRVKGANKGRKLKKKLDKAKAAPVKSSSGGCAVTALALGGATIAAWLRGRGLS